MTSHPIFFRIHAIQRMFERRVSEERVREVMKSGEMIEDYSDEMPYPSGLILGGHGNQPLHVVVAENTRDHKTVVITVYKPHPSQWNPGFRTRRK